MARIPNATWRPLKENETQASIKPTQVILHTAVDAPGPTRLPDYFDRTDISVESHVWIPLGGEIVQMLDTEVRADANRFANRRPDGTGAISIETEDEGNPEGVPWTEAQLLSIENVIRWANEVHGIPLVRCSTPSSPGIGYHSMFGAPSAWTPSAGKTCPGSTRIAQFDTVLMPRLTRATKQEVTIVNKSSADALAEALYGALLLRAPDSAGKAFWSGVGQEKGALEMITGFLVSANAEIVKARKAADAERAFIRQELEVLKELVADHSPAAVGVDAVIEEIVARLED